MAKVKEKCEHVCPQHPKETRTQKIMVNLATGAAFTIFVLGVLGLAAWGVAWIWEQVF